MHDTVRTGEPTVLQPATSWDWDVSYSHYPPSDGWTLEYAVSGADQVTFEASANAENDGYEVRLDPDHEHVAGLPHGLYALVGRVTDDTDTHEVYRDVLLIREDHFERAAKQLHDEKMLAVLDAVLEDRLPDDLQFMQIGGRSISAIPVEKLLKIQGIYRTRVANLRDPRGVAAQAGRFVYRG